MHDTQAIWTRARAMFARAAQALGSAAALAAIALLTPARRREIMAWLAPLEHVVRKLLLAEAHALAQDARPGVRVELVKLRSWTAGLQTRIFSNVKQSASEDARSKIDLTQPETWRARFAFALPRPNYVSAAHAPRIRSLGDTHARPAACQNSKPSEVRVCHPTTVCHPTHAAYHLARRFEALRRVLDDPRPHAERLAHALRAANVRCPQTTQRYLYAPCRTNDVSDDPRLGLDAILLASAYVDSS